MKILYAFEANNRSSNSESLILFDMSVSNIVAFSVHNILK